MNGVPRPVRTPPPPSEDVPRTVRGNYPRRPLPLERPPGSTWSIRPDRERNYLTLSELPLWGWLTLGATLATVATMLGVLH